MTDDALKNLVGTIEEKEITESPADAKRAWTRCTYKIKNLYYSTFDQEQMKFKTGDVVFVDYVTDGKYKNIKAIRLAGNNEKASAGSESNEGVDWIAKEKRIIRQNCNQRAIEFVELMSKVQPDEFKAIIHSDGVSLQSLIDQVSEHFENRVWRE